LNAIVVSCTHKKQQPHVDLMSTSWEPK